MITLCCQITRGFNFVKSIDGTDGLYNSINLFFLLYLFIRILRNILVWTISQYVGLTYIIQLICFYFYFFIRILQNILSVDYISICRSYDALKCAEFLILS